MHNTTVPARNKEAINSCVRTSDYRYIDIAKAVGADGTGAWYTGYLNPGDQVHPTELGAKAIAARVLVDVPEVMQYGLLEFTTDLEDTAGDN